MTTVAIVEPQRMTRIGIEHVVTTDAALRVVVSVADMADLSDVDVDVIVLSARACPDPRAAVRGLDRGSAVLMMTDAPTSAQLMASIHAGVGGFVTPDVSDTDLRNAIHAVAAGAFYLMAGLTVHLQHEPTPPEPPRDNKLLARREVETIRLIASGYTHSQIARRMGLSEATVNTYVKRIRTKLNAGNKAELTRRAIDLGYVRAGSPVIEPVHVRPTLAAVPVLDRTA